MLLLLMYIAYVFMLYNFFKGDPQIVFQQDEIEQQLLFFLSESYFDKYLANE